MSEEEKKSLARKERDLEKIFEALDDVDTTLRKKAVTRINELFDEFSDEEAEKIRVKLKEALKTEKRILKVRPLQLKIESVLLRYNKFHSKEERIAEVKRIKTEEKAEVKRIKTEEKAEKARKKETERLKLENERNKKESEKLREKTGLEENLELAKYTLVTRESKSRLPAFELVRNLLMVLGALYVVLGLGVLLYSPDVIGFTAIALLSVVAITFFFQAELIKFLSDFHDNNFMNLKVRIETLKVLEKINENLKKK